MATAQASGRTGGGEGLAEVIVARRAAIGGHPLVIAVGGDGTIHEVVNGLMQARSGEYGTKAASAQLGIIGQGTGGDFRKMSRRSASQLSACQGVSPAMAS